ncbi:MAG: pseudouridine synthase [Candidatus Amoebophilus sp. 36-38]|nr:MAG: pseudouridine synthase [Candidatus Amoebophilus sp. 36-38]
MKQDLPNSSKELPNRDGYIRLNKWISNAGVCSRREADALIQAGRISVNGQKITTLGYQVRLTDIVKFRDTILKPDKNVYILFNKPRNCITTAFDSEGRRTVLDFVKDACQERVYPVGRLDRNTTGLLLLTNDGDLAQKLAHPSYQIKKLYQVELATAIRPRDLEAIKSGVELKDGIVEVDSIATAEGDESKLGIEIHSGKNRIIRRLFEHLGYQIINLDRVMYANLTKKELPRGKWRFLTNQEVNYLKRLS